MKRWLPVVVAVLTGTAFGVAAYALASANVGDTGDWRHGAQRFIGFAGALGVFAGYVVSAFVVRGARLVRGGFTLTYPTIIPRPAGYREVTTLTVGDLVARLRKAGYEPDTQGCDETGSPQGALDPTTPLAGCNLAIIDRKVAGWVRLELVVPREGQPRGFGLIETWSKRGPSTDELALFVIRILDGLVGEVSAAREDSRAWSIAGANAALTLR
jgi:hypothetical protein